METLHRQFCKFILNVPHLATSVGVYGELGRQLRRKVLSIKQARRSENQYSHWEKVVHMRCERKLLTTYTFA